MHYSLRLNVARNVLQYYFNSATKLSPAALTSRLMQGVKIASDGTEVLSSGLEGLEACGRDLYTVDEFYEVERTARWIGRGGFKRVALQFPDELLRDSAAVSWRVLEKIGAEEGQEVRLFITGDTSYGSCCVDEVAAQHYAAEAIVHFGRACLSPTAASIPVLYVFGRRKLDTAQCAQALASAARTVPMGSKVLVLYDVMYLHSIPDILEAMRDAQESDLQNRLIVGYPRPQEGHSVTVSDESGGSGHQHQQECGGIAIAGLRVDGISCEDDLNTTAMFFIGQEGRQLSNALMRCGGCVMKFSYDPERPLDLRVRDESAGGNRDLMRRYYLIQKAKDAEIIGIVVGTLGVREYDVVLSSVRTALAESGRKSYTFAVGKVNPAKLANFAEVGAFCLVACGENAMLDSRDFHAPVITPFELEIALGLREWCGYSSSAFEDLLLTQSTTERVIPAGDGADADEPYFSLVSGTYKGSRSIESTPAPRAAIEGDTESKGSSGAGQLSTFVSPAAEFLKRREYRGLVLEEDLPVHEAVEGSSGIASDLGGV